MITHRGIWAIAHMLSRSSSKHSCIPGAYPRKHLLIPCPTNDVVGHILSIVSNKRVALPLTKARIGLERQRQTCAVWAKRTEYSIEQIRQSLQRLKIAKIVRMQNLHNFRTISSVFFRHAFAIQVVNHWHASIAERLWSGTRLVTTTVVTLLETTLPVKKTLAQSRHMNIYSYVSVATCRAQLFPLCYES